MAITPITTRSTHGEHRPYRVILDLLKTAAADGSFQLSLHLIFSCLGEAEEEVHASASTRCCSRGRRHRRKSPTWSLLPACRTARHRSVDAFGAEERRGLRERFPRSLPVPGAGGGGEEGIKAARRTAASATTPANLKKEIPPAAPWCSAGVEAWRDTMPASYDQQVGYAPEQTIPGLKPVAGILVLEAAPFRERSGRVNALARSRRQKQERRQQNPPPPHPPPPPPSRCAGSTI